MPDHTDDNVLFDRLVDGELSEAERRELLVSLQDRDDGWRQCALAFLEAQAWKNQFREIVQPPETVDEPAIVRRDRLVKSHSAGWLAVAAGLLVTFTLGWLAGHRLLEDRPSGLDSVDSLAAAHPEPLPDAPLAPDAGAPNDDAITLWVRDTKGRPTPLEVPLVDADTLDRRFGVQFRSGIPDEVRRRAEEHGYQVESRRRYAPLWFDQGQPLVVPVEDTRIVPVSRPVF